MVKKKTKIFQVMIGIVAEFLILDILQPFRHFQIGLIFSSYHQ